MMFCILDLTGRRMFTHKAAVIGPLESLFVVSRFISDSQPTVLPPSGQEMFSPTQRITAGENGFMYVSFCFLFF